MNNMSKSLEDSTKRNMLKTIDKADEKIKKIKADSPNINLKTSHEDFLHNIIDEKNLSTKTNLKETELQYTYKLFDENKLQKKKY